MSPDILSGESKSRKMSSEWITSKKFDIPQTFIVKCPAIIQNVRQRTGSALDKMSSQANMNFAYSAFRPIICHMFKSDG